jgi:hypothetical protein
MPPSEMSLRYEFVFRNVKGDGQCYDNGLFPKFQKGKILEELVDTAL